MGTISSAKGTIGLQATGTPTGTALNGKTTIGNLSGEGETTLNSDIAHAFRVVSTGGSDEVELVFQTGVASATSGSPTITDGDGKDFEGETLPTMATLDALQVEADDGNSTFVTLATVGVLGGIGSAINPGQKILTLDCGADVNAATDVFRMTFNASGDGVTVTVIGSSS